MGNLQFRKVYSYKITLKGFFMLDDVRVANVTADYVSLTVTQIHPNMNVI